MTEKQIENKIKAYLHGLGDDVAFYKHSASASMPSGIPDIICSYKGRYVGIETKSLTGKLSPAQKIWQKKIQRSGGIYLVARSLEEVVECLKDL